MHERLLTIAEASRRVPALSEPQVRGLISRKEIEAIKVGHRWLIPEKEMQKRFGILFRSA